MGGPLAYVQNGDLIRFDVPNRSLNMVGIQGMRLTPEEVEAVLTNRKNTMKLKSRGTRKGVFRRYTENARSAMQGGGM